MSNVDFKVVVIGLDGLDKKLNTIRYKLGSQLKEPMTKALLYVHQNVPSESSVPLPAPGEWAAKTSPAQKRAFFAQLRDRGGWTARTNNMVRKITTTTRTIGATVFGFIGTNEEYAPWVISKEKINGKGPQAFFHMGRWFTLQEVVEKSQNGIVKIFSDWLGDLIK